MSAKKNQVPAEKKKFRQGHERKIILNRTLNVQCACIEDQNLDLEDEIEMELLKKICCCNKQKHKRSSNKFAGKTQTQVSHRLLAIIPATMSVAS